MKKAKKYCRDCKHFKRLDKFTGRCMKEDGLFTKLDESSFVCDSYKKTTVFKT